LIYNILITKEVRKFLDKRDKKFIQKVNSAFEKLKTNPFNHPDLDLKKLVNSKEDFRLRIGKYRFLYAVIDEKILIYVYKADSRGSIYKK